jgi:hypothetical protein
MHHYSFFPSRWTLVAAATLAAATLAACGDDEDGGTGGGGQGGGGTTAATTTGGATTATTSTTSQGGGTGTGGDAGTGGDTGSGGAPGTGGSGSGGEGGASNACPQTATTIDLEAFRTAAEEALAEAYPDAELGPAELVFQEMVNGVGIGAANEYGQLCALAELPAEHQPLGDELAAYCIGLGGFAETEFTSRPLMLVTVQEWGGAIAPPDGNPAGDDMMWFYTATSGLAGTEAGTEEAAQAIADALEAQFDGLTTDVFSFGALAFFASSPAELGAVFAFLDARDDVSYVERDGEVYATEYYIGPIVRIDELGGLDGEPLDLYPWAYLSQHWRAENMAFGVVPSLPEPWGPGRVIDSQDREFEITVKDGADPAACFEQAKSCFGMEDGANELQLLDPEYRAASLLLLDCVDSIEANEPFSL